MGGGGLAYEPDGVAPGNIQAMLRPLTQTLWLTHQKG